MISIWYFKKKILFKNRHFSIFQPREFGSINFFKLKNGIEEKDKYRHKKTEKQVLRFCNWREKQNFLTIYRLQLKKKESHARFFWIH